MLNDKQMISAALSGFVARGTKRGVDCEATEATRPRLLAHLWEANPAMAPKISPQFFERNLNGQHGHFTKIHLISKFNLPFPKWKLDVRFICVEIGLYSKNYTLQNLTLRFRIKFSNFRLRPQTPIGASSLHCTHWGLPYSNPTTLPIILGLRSAHDQNAEGVETKENGNGASHSPVDQRIWGSVVSRKPLRSSRGLPDR